MESPGAPWCPAITVCTDIASPTIVVLARAEMRNMEIIAGAERVVVRLGHALVFHKRIWGESA